ncbi:MAG: flagellar motor switch protein FliM [Lentisphaerae bacterium GWF2_45_14]|nr:MAG: flagellar motor switch protein FliM [Lentisphaerae bacterium GWF2_45_14]
MPNILNQDEIDSLLGAMERGEIDQFASEKKEERFVSDYNFRRPNLITKDQLRNFQTIHETFAKEMVSNLALYLRTGVEFNLVSTEQQQYGEFISSLSNITLCVVFSAEPLPGVAVIEINLSLVFGIVDMLLGGQGDIETEIRVPTEIEVAIMDPFVERILEKLQSCWMALMRVNLKKERHESDPEYIQAAPSDAPVVVLAFDAKIGFANGIVNICYPLPMIQEVNEHLDHISGDKDNYYGRKADKNTRKLVLDSLMNVPMPMSVALGDARIRGRDLMDLRQGDIVMLDKSIAEPVTVSVSGRPMFLARPGRLKDLVGIKICDRMHGGAESSGTPAVELDF